MCELCLGTELPLNAELNGKLIGCDKVLIFSSTSSGFRALRGPGLDGGELEVGLRLGQRHLHAPHIRGTNLHGKQVRGFSSVHSFPPNIIHKKSLSECGNERIVDCCDVTASWSDCDGWGEGRPGVSCSSGAGAARIQILNIFPFLLPQSGFSIKQTGPHE